MEYIEIEYNRDLKPLEAVMSGVNRPGDFFVSGAVELPMPKVEVEGVGILSFPVPDAQIAAMMRRAERAPYGRGRETIVDTSVRNVWQIAPGSVHIGGKFWAANCGSGMRAVRLLSIPAPQNFPSCPMWHFMPTVNTRSYLSGKATAFAWFTTSFKSAPRARAGF